MRNPFRVQSIQKEITIFARLRHPNVVTFFGYCMKNTDQRKPEIWAVMYTYKYKYIHIYIDRERERGWWWW